MTHKLTFPGRYPGRNELENTSRGNKYAAADKKKKLTESMAWTIKDNLKRKVKKAVYSFTYFEPDARRDPDNVAGGFHKPFFDAMQEAGVIDNDGQKQVKALRDDFEVDKTYPRVEITITELEAGE